MHDETEHCSFTLYFFFCKGNNEFTFTNDIQSSTQHSSIRGKLGIIKIDSTNSLGIDQMIQEGILLKIPTVYKNRLNGREQLLKYVRGKKILILQIVIHCIPHTKLKVSFYGRNKDKS